MMRLEYDQSMCGTLALIDFKTSQLNAFKTDAII